MERASATEFMAPSPHSNDAIAPGVRFPVLWPVLVVIGVLYGSLIPFHFQFPQFPAGSAFGLNTITWAATTQEDMVTNVLVYIPVGFTCVGFLLSRFRSSRRTTVRPLFRTVLAIPLALAVGITLSVVAEWLQTALPSRQPSWLDVSLNTAGTALGVLFGLLGAPFSSGAAAFCRGALRQQPCTVIARVLALGLGLAAWANLSFVQNTSELHQSLLRNGRSLFRAGPLPTLGGENSLNAITSAAAYCALGYFLALSRRERGHRPAKSLSTAATHAIVLATLVECSDVFTRFGNISLAMILLHSTSSAFGAWLAIFVLDRGTRSRWLEKRPLIAPTVLVASVVLFLMAMLVTPSVVALLSHTQSLAVPQVVWTPFHALWHRSMTSAAVYAIQTSTIFAVLTLATTILLRRAGVRPKTSHLLAAAFVVASISEGMQAISGSGTPDATVPVLALIAALLTLEFYGRLFADDGLTKSPVFAKR